MIRLAGVTKSFEGKKVLDSVSLIFPEAQTHVLLGSSGCGKSTLLRMIMGLIEPDSGELHVGETLVEARSQRELARRIGYVVQDGGLFPHLTVSENVSLVARILGWNKERIKDRISELANLVEMPSALLSQIPSRLSGGQKQRVGLMRALMLDPVILLMDEPLGALDPIVRAALQGQLKKIFNSLKKTVLIVTHDIGEAAFFGHTVTLLNSGRVAQHGTFGSFVDSPASAFVSEFINAQRPPPELKSIL